MTQWFWNSWKYCRGRSGVFYKKTPQHILDIANHSGTVNISLSYLDGSEFETALHFWLFWESWRTSVSHSWEMVV